MQARVAFSGSVDKIVYTPNAAMVPLLRNTDRAGLSGEVKDNSR